MISGVRKYLQERPQELRDRIAVLERGVAHGREDQVSGRAEVARLRAQLERLERYAPAGNGDDICPGCLSVFGQRHVLMPINSDAVDLFRRRNCRQELEARI